MMAYSIGLSGFVIGRILRAAAVSRIWRRLPHVALLLGVVMASVPALGQTSEADSDVLRAIDQMQMMQGADDAAAEPAGADEVPCPQEQAVYRNDPDTGFELQFVIPEWGSTASNPYEVLLLQSDGGNLRMNYAAGGMGGDGRYRVPLNYNCDTESPCRHSTSLYSIFSDGAAGISMPHPGGQAAQIVIWPELRWHIYYFFVRSELNDHFTTAPDDIWWLRDCRQ